MNQSQHGHRVTRTPVIGPSGAFHWGHTNQSQRRLRVSRLSVRGSPGSAKVGPRSGHGEGRRRGVPTLTARLSRRAHSFSLFYCFAAFSVFSQRSPRASRKDACLASRELSDPVEMVAGRFGTIPRAARNTLAKQHMKAPKFCCRSRSLQLPPPPGNST